MELGVLSMMAAVLLLIDSAVLNVERLDRDGTCQKTNPGCKEGRLRLCVVGQGKHLERSSTESMR